MNAIHLAVTLIIFSLRLYEDPRILLRSKVAAGDYPDIAKAAEEIAR